MKLFLTVFLYLFSPLVWGQVGVVSVTDEDKHTSTEDFYHTFEYQIQPLSKNVKWKKCQATRMFHPQKTGRVRPPGL